MKRVRMRRRGMLALASGLGGAGLGLGAMPLLAQSPAATKPLDRNGGPYVPTPWPVVDQMIRTATIGAQDLVMDLGCGDGRLVIAAAKRHGARGYGVDIDGELVRLANDTAAREGVGHLVRFEERNIFDTDVREATVLTLYLLPWMMMKLRPRFLSDLRPGTRIVAHDYHFEDWRAASEFTFDVPEKVAITGIPTTTVYLFLVPARVEGRWAVEAPGVAALDRGELVLRKTLNDFEGTIGLGGRVPRRLDATSLRGLDLRFALPVDGPGGRPGRAIVRARVDGDRMEGTIESTLSATTRFAASRLK
ncbi:MAG: class I SAM-dependent methyltransferase [Rhodocyclaceae bacterium]|jgi:SAM-dependent methyltransferase|nr:class I SAM-dependent methyltransferase [Rhodocyclaceae bacterium]MCE2981061.1 class I SAM-dependent methyltransferase [Betaproteobacteria bacterium]MCA3074243.1 class I SAM-dependent methyltransferase [Rhodocyclaceae bacterium]MCA3090928.1 class I SAM-dependent methyltransferase [Rhodocyclaceae bacterium]MCA3095036.1 class I SAM-dependent methyltransferase [Rhodocyclaceae bacterium]